MQLNNIYQLFLGYTERVYFEDIETASIKYHYCNNFEMKIGKIEIEEKIFSFVKIKSSFTFETELEKQNVLFFKTVAEE